LSVHVVGTVPVHVKILSVYVVKTVPIHVVKILSVYAVNIVTIYRQDIVSTCCRDSASTYCKDIVSTCCQDSVSTCTQNNALLCSQDSGNEADTESEDTYSSEDSADEGPVGPQERYGNKFVLFSLSDCTDLPFSPNFLPVDVSKRLSTKQERSTFQGNLRLCRRNISDDNICIRLSTFMYTTNVNIQIYVFLLCSIQIPCS
jgi:hypothetical protein